MRILIRALLLAAAWTTCGMARADAAATDWAGDPRARVRLITGSDTVGAGPLRAGLEFSYAPGWHGYWRTPGDAGIAPVLDWAGSQNGEAPSVFWPAPTRLIVSGLQNSVYEGRFVLPMTIERPDPHTATMIRLAVDYAACSTICVPAHADLTLAVPVGPGGASAETLAIAAAQARVPQSPAAAGFEVLRSSLEPAGSATNLVVEVRSTMPFASPDLFVEGAGDGLPPAPTVQLSDDGHRATLTETLAPGRPEGPLTLTLVDGDRSAEFTRPPVTAALPPAAVERGWVFILASALLGGLILNLMPCVLPILSIKLFSLSRHAGAERRAVRLGFIATALGIVTCFLGLAAALIGVKWSGATIGWGIQFQQPWFLAGVSGLTVLFAASFFDWLAIGLPQAFVRLSGATSRVALVEAYLAGVFSTLLATPCSAPFVGTAVGFALAQGPREILAVFLCLGLGMATPFLAAAMAPGLVAWLPRPGPWMLRLRKGLGLLLLGTTVWLLVVLDSVAGVGPATLVGVFLAALLAFRFWVTSARDLEGRSWPGLATAGLALVAVAAAFWPASGGAGARGDGDGWQAFDQLRLDQAIAAGKTVLVDVTASWCLTCKVNEATALETAVVRARFAQPGTMRMRADWSRPNPAVAGYLQHFARFGIPLDVVYGPGRPGGEALPELLSATTVVDALDRAGGRTVAGAPS